MIWSASPRWLRNSAFQYPEAELSSTTFPCSSSLPASERNISIYLHFMVHMYYSTYLRWYDPGNESMTHTICSQTRNLAKEQSKWSGIRSNQNEAMCLQSTYSHVAQYHCYLILKRGCLLRISATSVKIKRSIRCTWLSSHTHEISMFCIVHPIKGARNRIETADHRKTVKFFNRTKCEENMFW